MIKRYIKKHIKMRTYRVIENEKKNLEKELKTKDKQLNNTKKDFTILINSLKAENRSLKQIYLEKDIQYSPNYNQLTIIIPYCKTEDPERNINLDITLHFLSKIGIKRLIISEHSNRTSEKFLKGKYEDLFDSFRVIFNKGDLFNKSHAINEGVIASKTPYIAIFDMDCLTTKKNIDLAIYLLNKGFEVVHPFNRAVKDIVNKESFRKEYDFQKVKSPIQYRDWADGGIVFWNKLSFISIGMSNEYFVGWGGEDNEILIRANLCQLKQIRIDNILYHLYHERPQIRTKNNVEQLEKILKIKTKEELLKEVSKWPWVIKTEYLMFN